MGAVRLTWILNHGTADSVQSLIYVAEVEDVREEVGLDAECCGSAYGCRPARESEHFNVRPDWVETEFLRLTPTSRRSNAEAVKVRRLSCSKWVAKRVSCDCLYECVLRRGSKAKWSCNLCEAPSPCETIYYSQAM